MDSTARGARLGFGGWAVGGSQWGNPGDEAERLAAVRRAVELGVTFFDTAPTYGASERILGRALAPHRSAVAIATKVGPRDDPRASLEASLRRLGTDHVELVQLHEPGERFEWSIESLHALQGEGKAGAIGLCNATSPQLARALEIAPLRAYQAPYNLVDRDVEQRELPLVRARGLAFIAYRPLASGLLTGTFDASAPPAFEEGDHRRRIYWFRGREFARRQAVVERLRPIAEGRGSSLAALALGWVLARLGVSVVLAGARTPRQVEENAAALERPLDPEEVAAIDAAVASLFRPARATPAARESAVAWGPRERFIIERLDGATPARRSPRSGPTAPTGR